MARKSKQPIYGDFRNHTKNKPYIDAIPTNEDIGSSVKWAAGNKVIQELKTNLIKEWESEDKLIAAVAGMRMFHVVAGATDVSIKDDHNYAKELNNKTFKGLAEITNIVQSIDIHFIGDDDTEHVHIIFR